jgi:hypothetical protein
MKTLSKLVCVSLFCCFMPDTTPAQLTRGLLVHYTFDKNEGAMVTDNSGQGRNANVNGAIWVPEGARGGAYRFDNNSQNIKATDAGLPAADAPRTVALWLKTDKDYEGGCTGMLGYGTDNFRKQFTGIGFDWRHDRDRVYFSPGGSCFLAKMKVPATGTWMHVAYTYGGDGAHHLYLDGKPCDGMSEISGARLKTQLSGQLLLGGHPNGEGPDGGYIDDVRIYDRVLSPEELAELAVPGKPAKAEKSGKPLPEGFPLGFLAGACVGGLAGFLIARLLQKKSTAAN